MTIEQRTTMPQSDRFPDPPDDVRQLRARLDRAEAQRRLLARICGMPLLDDLLGALASEIEGTGGFHAYMINLLDEAGANLVCERIRLPEEYRGVEDAYRGFKFPMDAAEAAVDSFRRGKSVVASRMGPGTGGDAVKARFEHWNFEAAAFLPLAGPGVAVGSVAVFSRSAHISRRRLAALRRRLALFAEPVRNALAQRRLQRNESLLPTIGEERRRFLQVVTDVAKLTTVDSIYDHISHELLSRFPFDLVAFLMAAGERVEFETAIVADTRHSEIADGLKAYYQASPYTLKDAGATPTVLRSDAPLYFQDLRDAMDLPMPSKDKQGLAIMKTPRTVYLVPILQQEKAVGVLWLVSLANPVDLPRSDRDLIEQLCEFMGTALANARLYDLVARQNKEIEELNRQLAAKVDRLGVQAAHDPLTGLSNFGVFESDLRRRINEYTREGQVNALALVMLDVDHFKRFNDTYGHPAGNQVLKELARRILSQARAMDVPCRYGGEEFGVILPECDLSGATSFCERLRRGVAEEPFIVEERPVYLTISCGCTVYRTGESRKTFVKRADVALYNAKNRGRNRTEAIA